MTVSLSTRLASGALRQHVLPAAVPLREMKECLFGVEACTGEACANDECHDCCVVRNGSQCGDTCTVVLGLSVCLCLGL